jgi:hypothetical protein
MGLHRCYHTALGSQNLQSYKSDQNQIICGLVRLTWRNSPILFAETRLTQEKVSASGGDSTKDNFGWIL